MNKQAIALLTLSLVAALASTSQPAQARKWTISERQRAVAYKIKAGERSGELTLKEANDLRDKLSDISSKISEYRADNGGKLSYKDQGKIESRLNDVSNKIHKLELEKRVTPR